MGNDPPDMSKALNLQPHVLHVLTNMLLLFLVGLKMNASLLEILFFPGALTKWQDLLKSMSLLFLVSTGIYQYWTYFLLFFSRGFREQMELHMFLFSPVSFKGNLSLLDFFYFSGGLKQMEARGIDAERLRSKGPFHGMTSRETTQKEKLPSYPWSFWGRTEY